MPESEIFKACKELIDDAKTGCADLIFKEVCLEILAKASQVLAVEESKALVKYAEGELKEKPTIKKED